METGEIMIDICIRDIRKEGRDEARSELFFFGGWPSGLISSIHDVEQLNLSRGIFSVIDEDLCCRLSKTS